MTENKNDYIKDAMRTVSGEWYGEYVSAEDLSKAVTESIAALQKLDKIKKKLFYGKGVLLSKKALNVDDVFSFDYAQNILHGVLGVATEAGELLELICDWVTSCELDFVNLIEEQGDSFWYHALLASEHGKNFEDIQAINIAKLKARYPEKFTCEAANNRDLEKEREILQKDID